MANEMIEIPLKYIDADLLRKEIEKRLKNIRDYMEVDIEKEYTEFVVSDPVYSKLVNGIVGKAIARHFYELGCRHAAVLYDDIEYERQRRCEDEPKGLDEAAEEIASDIAPTYPDIDWDGCFEKIKDGFKAGAKWMAGQGDYLEAEIEEPDPLYWRILLELPGTFMVDHNLKPGDKVVVQIRKK